MVVEKYEKLREVANKNSIERWTLKGKVCAGIAVSIYDGDTFDAVVQIGDGDIKRLTIRMLGYNSPEIKVSRSLGEVERLRNHEAAVQARDHLWELLGGAEKALLRLECFDWDKYGRLLARVYRVREGDCIQNWYFCVNDRMMEDLDSCSKPFMTSS